MDSKRAALNVAGIVFFLMAVLHLLRLIFHWEVIVAGFTVPTWPSTLLAALAFILSLWMFKSVR